MAQWIARQTSDLKVQGSSPCVDFLFLLCLLSHISRSVCLLPSLFLHEWDRNRKSQRTTGSKCPLHLERVEQSQSQLAAGLSITGLGGQHFIGVELAHVFLQGFPRGTPRQLRFMPDEHMCWNLETGQLAGLLQEVLQLPRDQLTFMRLHHKRNRNLHKSVKCQETRHLQLHSTSSLSFVQRSYRFAEPNVRQTECCSFCNVWMFVHCGFHFAARNVFTTTNDQVFLPGTSTNRQSSCNLQIRWSPNQLITCQECTDNLRHPVCQCHQCEA
jgi:hypothetical protein